jgi:hypothetical protein
MSLIPLVATAVLCAALAACTGMPEPGAAEAADGGVAGGSAQPDWDLSGVIASVQQGAGTTRVTVQVARDGTPGEQAVLLVSPRTEITVRAADGASRPGDMLDLVPGARIDARHTGAELRSLPPQYHATAIRVLAG